MKVFELNRDGGLLLDVIRRQRATEAARTGLHVSTICDDIIKTIDRRRYDKEISPTSTIAFQEIGNVLEDVLAARLRRRLRGWVKPDPRADSRGVVGSPDGYRRGSRTIDEVKATWVTEGIESKNPFVRLHRGRVVEESLKFFRYRIQATHYAYIWKADRICLHVLFVNGNYRPPFPNFRTFVIALTERDKRRNAEYLWRHAMDRQWLKNKNGIWITTPPVAA